MKKIATYKKNEVSLHYLGNNGKGSAKMVRPFMNTAPQDRCGQARVKEEVS